MDFAQAALLVAAVFAAGLAVDRIWPTAKDDRVKAAVHLALGIGITFLVAYSTYGTTQKVGNVPLDEVNVAGLVLIGLMIGGGASVAQQGLMAISKIGATEDMRNR